MSIEPAMNDNRPPKINRKFPPWHCLPVLLICLTMLSGCAAGVPDRVTVVDDFEIERYLGRWYEVARLDHRFERGMSNVTAEYSLREGGGITVLNRGYVAEKGQWKDAEGKAFFVAEPNRGQLKVSFFGPFYGGYNIMSLNREADDYGWSLVAGPDTSYLWILSRTPDLPENTYQMLVQQAADAGFPIQELIRVDHGRQPE